MNTTTLRWVIRKSGFPFALPGAVIGSVLSDDRGEAITLAQGVFGKAIIVEREKDPSEVDPFPYRNELKDRAEELLASPRAMRIMTPIEIQMARALGCLRVSGPARSTIRRLHAESYRPTPEISDQLASRLRQMVHQHRGQLPPELVESVGGAP